MKDIRRVLDESELAFLLHHQIPLNKVFDAYGLPTHVYKSVMRPEGYLIACRTNPCGASGHRLRTNAGHCAQCKPARIEYAARWKRPGVVYIAWSEKMNLTKVGFTQDPVERISTLNSTEYAGTNDWYFHYLEPTVHGGKLESLVHQELRAFQSHAVYVKSGHEVECNEVFDCTPEVAIACCKKLAT